MLTKRRLLLLLIAALAGLAYGLTEELAACGWDGHLGEWS